MRTEGSLQGRPAAILGRRGLRERRPQRESFNTQEAGPRPPEHGGVCRVTAGKVVQQEVSVNVIDKKKWGRTKKMRLYSPLRGKHKTCELAWLLKHGAFEFSLSLKVVLASDERHRDWFYIRQSRFSHFILRDNFKSMLSIAPSNATPTTFPRIHDNPHVDGS